MEAGGFRHLQGGYVDWDEINSRVNTLRKSLSIGSVKNGLNVKI